MINTIKRMVLSVEQGLLQVASYIKCYKAHGYKSSNVNADIVIINYPY
jgi:hypothetical protein